MKLCWIILCNAVAAAADERVGNYQRQLLPSVPSDAACQAAQSWWRHPHFALDLHQVFSGSPPIYARKTKSKISPILDTIVRCGISRQSASSWLSHKPGSKLPLLSARPAVNIPAAENYRPLASTKLYCLVTEAHVCEQLPRSWNGRESKPRPRECNALTIYAIMPYTYELSSVQFTVVKLKPPAYGNSHIVRAPAPKRGLEIWVSCTLLQKDVYMLICWG